MVRQTTGGRASPRPNDGGKKRHAFQGGRHLGPSWRRWPGSLGDPLLPGLLLFLTLIPCLVGLFSLELGQARTGQLAEKATLGSRLGAGRLGENMQRPQPGWFPTLRVAGTSLPLPTLAPPHPGREEVGTQPEVCGQGHRKGEKNETFLVWLLSSKLLLFLSSVLAEFCIFRVLVSREYSLMVILNAPQGPRCRLEHKMLWTRAAALRRGKRFALEIHRTAPCPGREPVSTGTAPHRGPPQRTPSDLTNSPAGRNARLMAKQTIHAESRSPCQEL